MKMALFLTFALALIAGGVTATSQLMTQATSTFEARI